MHGATQAAPRLAPPAAGRWAGGPAAIGVLATLLLALLTVALRREAAPHGDEQIYERMATDPLGAHTFPFGFRIGVPLVVHLLPLAHQTGFVLLALLCAGAAAGVLHALMTQLGTPRGVSAAAALAFAISPGVLVVLLRNGRSVDAATLLVMVSAALFVVRRQPAALAATLLAGAFVRESALFMIPFAYAVWAERWVDARALRRTLAAGAPAVAAYVALRLSVATVGAEHVVGYGQGLLAGRVTVVRTALAGWTTELRRVFLAFGPLWLVAPLALREMRYARRGLVLVALCALAATWALDWGRVMLLAAPVVYPAAGFALARRPRLRVPLLAGWLALCLVYAAYMDASGVARHLDAATPPTYPVR